MVSVCLFSVVGTQGCLHGSALASFLCACLCLARQDDAVVLMMMAVLGFCSEETTGLERLHPSAGPGLHHDTHTHMI